jgi:nucleotide-binding universal stress UspA family protein
MFRRIVVPLDGSPLSEAILPEIERLAANTPTQVILLSVAPIPETIERRDDTIAYLDQLMQEEATELQRYLARHAHRLIAAGVRVQTRVRFGDPATEIVACADEEEADAIAMCTHGRSGLDRLIHGSVAGTVLRSTRRPVLLLRPTEAAFARERVRAGALSA